MRHPIDNNAPERFPLQAPKPTVLHALYRCRPRFTVHETQLAKTHPWQADVRDY